MIVAFPGTEVIKLFSYSTQLISIFQLRIKTKIPTNNEVSFLKSLMVVCISLLIILKLS